MGFFVNVQKPSQLQNLRRVPGGGRQARWQINRELVVLFEPGVQELKKITSRCALCWRPVSIQAKAAMLPFGPTRSFCRIIAYVGCLRTSGLDLLAARLSESDPSPTSPLRHPGYAHALTDALAFGEIRWVITVSAVPVAADCKAWIKRKSCLCSSTRLIRRAEQR
jgi:hypothetical protein